MFICDKGSKCIDCPIYDEKAEPCDNMTEVASVVRCKNCKYWDNETKFPICHYWEDNTNYNDFCSRGVRCIDKSEI